MALHQKQYKGYIFEDGNVSTCGCAIVSAVDVDKEEVVLNWTCHLKYERIWARDTVQTKEPVRESI